MSHQIELTWEIFISIADNLFYINIKRQLTKLEKELLKCYWNGITSPSSISKILNHKRSELNYYYNNDSYFRMGLEPNLMKSFSNFIGVPVNKKNFREVFQRIWQRYV